MEVICSSGSADPVPPYSDADTDVDGLKTFCSLFGSLRVTARFLKSPPGSWDRAGRQQTFTHWWAILEELACVSELRCSDTTLELCMLVIHYCHITHKSSLGKLLRHKTHVAAQYSLIYPHTSDALMQWYNYSRLGHFAVFYGCKLWSGAFTLPQAIKWKINFLVSFSHVCAQRRIDVNTALLSHLYPTIYILVDWWSHKT